MDTVTYTLKSNERQLCIEITMNDSTKVEYCIESEDGTPFLDLEGETTVVQISTGQKFNLSSKKVYDDVIYCLYHDKISDGKDGTVENVEKQYGLKFSSKDIVREVGMFASLCGPICG